MKNKKTLKLTITLLLGCHLFTQNIHPQDNNQLKIKSDKTGNEINKIKLLRKNKKYTINRFYNFTFKDGTYLKNVQLKKQNRTAFYVATNYSKKILKIEKKALSFNPVISKRQSFLKNKNRRNKKKNIKNYFFNAYFRAMARDDLGNNSATLGWWPLYGRLLNETPWLMAETGYQGDLSNYKFTQMYFETENVLLKSLTTQTGSLWYNMGYIGIFDMYVSQVFWETIGFRAGQKIKSMEYFIGIGNSGYYLHNEKTNVNGSYSKQGYNSVPTVGALFKYKKKKLGIFKYIKTGLSGMFLYERKNENNPTAPHQTTDLTYEEIIRGKTLENFLLARPGQEDFFPGPTATSASSYRFTAWLGFAMKKFGPVKLNWNDLSIQYVKKHPLTAITETYNNISKDIFISEFTDEKYSFMIVDEMQWTFIPQYLDVTIGLLFGYSWDEDNTFRPDDDNRILFSAVIQPHYYITEYLHALFEISYAREKSTIGNRYREHFDSIMSNTAGVPDNDGLEWGDTDTKHTWQFKFGPMINPKGRGIYNRPSIRLLMGIQYSNVHAAYGNSYIESLERKNIWNNRQDSHWHYMFSAEVEHWFSI